MTGTRVLAIIILLVVALSACTQLPGPNRQGYAGITQVEVDLESKTVSVIDGKEKESVSWSGVISPDGTVDITYEASDVKAFPAIEVRGEVEKVLIEAQVEAAPAVTATIMDAILKVIGK